MSIHYHDLANIFPLVEGAEFDALCADIAAHGVREPITLFEGAILDGRNRYRAAQAAGVECPMVDYVGDDAAAFVVSLNIHRRHLTESQRAMAAARLANMPRGANQHTAIAVSSFTQSVAAKLLNVSEDSIQRAKHVHDEAPAEIVRAVDGGRMSVSLAVKVADLPEECSGRSHRCHARCHTLKRPLRGVVSLAMPRPLHTVASGAGASHRAAHNPKSSRGRN